MIEGVVLCPGACCRQGATLMIEGVVNIANYFFKYYFIPNFM